MYAGYLCGVSQVAHIIVSRTAHCRDRDGTRSHILHHVLVGCQHCKSPRTSWSAVQKAVRSILSYVSVNQITDPVEACVRPGHWVSPNTQESVVVVGGSRGIGEEGQEEGEGGERVGGGTVSGLGECHGAQVSDVESREEVGGFDISPVSEESEQEQSCSRGRGACYVWMYVLGGKL
jgi:hypothetical protein